MRVDPVKPTVLLAMIWLPGQRPKSGRPGGPFVVRWVNGEWVEVEA